VRAAGIVYKPGDDFFAGVHDKDWVAVGVAMMLVVVSVLSSPWVKVTFVDVTSGRGKLKVVAQEALSRLRCNDWCAISLPPSILPAVQASSPRIPPMPLAPCALRV
jgi:hypothetical protein